MAMSLTQAATPAPATTAVSAGATPAGATPVTAPGPGLAGLVWCDGLLHPAEAALVPVDDHGLVVGDGVFETLATSGGTAFAVRRHLDRLRRSAAGMGLEVPFSDAVLAVAMAAVIASHPDPDQALRVRLTVTAGSCPLGSARGGGPCRVIVAAGPLGTVADRAAVVVVPWVRNERGALSGLKTTSYGENVLALAYAHRHGGDEAIFANTVGELCEGTGSNIFVVIHDEVLTPPLSSGCLAGVTRALVLEAGLAREATLPLSALYDASEAFLTSTARLGQPVGSVDGKPLAPPGPRTQAVSAALHQLMERNENP